MDLPDIKETYLGGNVDEAFNKLKNDTTIMMIPRSVPQPVATPSPPPQIESQPEPEVSTIEPPAMQPELPSQLQMEAQMELRSPCAMQEQQEQLEQHQQEVQDIQQQLQQQSEDDTDICTHAEVKDIWNDLEKEEKGKTTILENEELFHLRTASLNRLTPDAEMMEIEQKHELETAMSQDVGPEYTKFEKSTEMMTSEPFRPKPTGPYMMYEILSEDGFTCTSTSINDLWDKVKQLVQGARKSRELPILPEGPLADMSGLQMIGLKANAVKYLLEQLPGAESCNNYTAVYHKRAQSTLSQDASSGYCSDFEDLKENYYGASRIEGYHDRSEYDMFSWLASRHRKQPVQLTVQPNLDIESNIR